MLLVSKTRARGGLGNASSWFAGAGLVQLALLVGVVLWVDSERRRR